MDSLNVLIVDDIEENRNLLERRLVRSGHQVTHANNGRQALDCLQQDSFDLVMLDIMMPVMDGISTLAEIRSESNYDDIAIIMVTAIDNMNVAIECMRNGACGYITKPFDGAKLNEQIAVCMQNR